MEQNINNDNIILKKEDYYTLIEQLMTMNNKINELIEVFSLNKDNFSIESKNMDIKKDLKKDIKNLRAEEIISQKQYIVLIYMLENKYQSDVSISKLTGVSYSSLYQWKKKDSCFKEMYKKILLIKDM